MAAITIQQVEQNLAAMPEEQRAVAEEAMSMLSDEQLQSVLNVFDVQISMEQAPQPEAPMEQPMPEEELPTLPMPEEEPPPAPPIDQEMQQLKLGGMPERSMPRQADAVAGVIDDEAVANTEANTVSDKSDINFENGSYIINASAVRKAGLIDILERLIKPAAAQHEKMTGEKIDVGKITRPIQQVDGDVPGRISEQEVYVPPQLVALIGEDLLDKINARGKEETEEKIEETQEAPQGQAPVRAQEGGKVDKNLDMLARILFSEAGVDGEAGMQAVANVVMNRIKDETAGFGNLKEASKVISQKNAFSSYGKKDYNNPSGPNYEIAKRLARQALSKEGLEDITGGALHFRNPDIREKDNPKAATEKEQKFFDDQMASGRYILSKIIGQHHFYVDSDSNVTNKTMEPFTTEVTGTPVTFQGMQPIPDSELPTPENIERAEQSADTMISYFEPEEEEDVKPFDPVKNRREKRRQRRLAATR